MTKFFVPLFCYSDSVKQPDMDKLCWHFTHSKSLHKSKCKIGTCKFSHVCKIMWIFMYEFLLKTLKRSHMNLSKEFSYLKFSDSSHVNCWYVRKCKFWNHVNFHMWNLFTDNMWNYLRFTCGFSHAKTSSNIWHVQRVKLCEVYMWIFTSENFFTYMTCEMCEFMWGLHVNFYM